MTLTIPRGRLLRSRCVPDIRAVLLAAFERELTGYTIVEPTESPLCDEQGTIVFTFESGLPLCVYHTESGRGGQRVLSEIAAVGPYRLDLYALSAEGLRPLCKRRDLRVPPAMPAERLVGDQELAERVNRRWSERETICAIEEGATTEHVGAFLDDAEGIEAIKEAARAQAERKATEWDLESQLS